MAPLHPNDVECPGLSRFKQNNVPSPLGRLLGSGAWAHVYSLRWKDEKLAWKLLRPEIAGDTHANLVAFFREARALKHASPHP